MQSSWHQLERRKEQGRQKPSVWSVQCLYSASQRAALSNIGSLLLWISSILRTHIQLSTPIAGWNRILIVRTFWLSHWIWCARFQDCILSQALGDNCSHGLVHGPWGEGRGSQVLKELYSRNVHCKIYTVQIIWHSFPSISFQTDFSGIWKIWTR